MLCAATIKLRSFATVSSHEGGRGRGEIFSFSPPIARTLKFLGLVHKFRKISDPFNMHDF